MMDELPDGGKNFMVIYVHEDGMALKHRLKSTAEAGLCCLIVLQNAFKERFAAVGADQEIKTLKECL